MRMINQIAFANMKYHKSKNILTGIAIFLTTILLFLIPTMGVNLLDGQAAAINELYPNWHAVFRNVDENTVEKLAVHHTVGNYGLRSDAGCVVDSEASIALLYLDEKGFELYKVKLLDGHLPVEKNEIVVSKGMLEELGCQGEVGDTIQIPYQMYRNGGLDFAEEKEFVISGFLEEEESAKEQKAYSAFISEAFLQEEIPEDEIMYRFLFQVQGSSEMTVDDIEDKIAQLANQFEIKETAIAINNDYLWANYVDPAYVPGIVGIMLIIVLAGIITIYSIYYVAMGERIQEFGRLKAIGATKRQLRQIVLREGLAVAVFAVPAGLLAGTILARLVFLGLLEFNSEENVMMMVLKELLDENKFQMYHGWLYLLTAVVTLMTVCLSLLRPMRTAAKVSEIEAMRYQDSVKGSTKKRRGYLHITVGRLAKVYLTGNKKKSVITICSMAATGMFLMVAATILSCANPVESANNTVLGQYEIFPIVEYGNKEHPEREWGVLQQNNPLTDELKNEIEQIDGIESVVCFSNIYAVSEAFEGEREGILGVPESYREELEKGIIKGAVTYEELLTGNKVIVDKNLLYWYPDIEVGDILTVEIEAGSKTYEKKLEVAAIGSYSIAFSHYSYLIMAQEGLTAFSDYSLNFYYQVFADKKYDEAVEKELEALIEESGMLEMQTWQEVYEQDKSVMAIVSYACYAFLGVLGAICIMNMVNTMIHSVHVRKKEIGMLQAIGMSDTQLLHMLQMEGMFYTIGTLILSVGGGSLLGYPVFLLAKENGVFNISNYHYPTAAAIIVSVILCLIQLALTTSLGKSVKKESLIDRIRLGE